MKISNRGIINRGEPNTPRAFSTFPALTPLADGSLLATYRVGSSKDSADGTLELKRSDDGGQSWSTAATPFATALNGLNGSLRVGYITDLGNGHLLLAALWVDRQTYPGQPLFNEETEGCLPMEIVIADSHDLGRTWSDWRVVSVPPDVGPPSLTNPVLVLPSGRLALSIETNKTYLDRDQWLQRVVYLYSEDQGQTWSEPVTTCQDPTGRIFNWDQRAGVCPDGRVITFTWTYDRQTTQYLNIQRHLSADEGATWSAPDDLGFPDQAAHPAILPDGRVVLAYVDRFQSHSIRARLAPAADAPFDAASEVELYRQTINSPQTAAGQGDTGDLLAEMGLWSFGLPFSAALPDGTVMVVYYAGDDDGMEVRWARLSL